MRRKWMLCLLTVLILCGCQADKTEKTEDEQASYYLIPHGLVMTKTEVAHLLAISDKVAYPLADGVLAIICGYCCDGQMVLQCDDLSFVDTMNLTFMDRTLEGYVDHGRQMVFFNDKAFAEEGYTDEELAEQPMRLILNEHSDEAVTLTMSNVQAVNDLHELGQVVTHDGVSILCIMDEDGKGAVLAAISDDDGGRHTPGDGAKSDGV